MAYSQIEPHWPNVSLIFQEPVIVLIEIVSNFDTVLQVKWNATPFLPPLTIVLKS